ncbi:MAG: hypothetical protein A2V88_17790 [Elusimicrobia bacterium RBG_16_66_12]|nr:MAG: hypothetical protein A2V88_17790 [Elusimicrobia bacterium RBG_16_66_12]
MGYRRMNITLPEPLAKRLDKVANKSAFIARAVAGRMAALEKAEFRRRLIQDYREAANDPEFLKDERQFILEGDSVIGDGLEKEDW